MDDLGDLQGGLLSPLGIQVSLGAWGGAVDDHKQDDDGGCQGSPQNDRPRRLVLKAWTLLVITVSTKTYLLTV